MRKVTIFGVGVLALLLALSLVHKQSAVADGPAAIQTADVNWHMQSGSGPVDGAWAKLLRNDNGASFTFHARELNPGHVYTVWFATVNNPSACATTHCSAADIILNSAAVASDVTYGAGHVAGQSGQAAFGGHIAAGDLPNGWLGNGFTNPRGAEIHLVLNDHGPAIPDLLSNMLHSYRGGCTDESLPPIFPATAFADGIPGPNTCRLYQVAIFQP
ncbi:MAG TPA: hypothetical protein VF177_18165 [Anaerolineae bacterium]